MTAIVLMTSLSASSQNGVANTTKKTFSRTTTISAKINAHPSIVWTLLSNADDYSRWNSTIISIEGQIEQGEKIQLKSTLAPNRTFKLKIQEMKPHELLIWGDAMGKRTFRLTEEQEGTRFTMTERIGSVMFPLFAGKIPSFDEAFEQFTADLKKEAEAISQVQ